MAIVQLLFEIGASIYVKALKFLDDLAKRCPHVSPLPHDGIFAPICSVRDKGRKVAKRIACQRSEMARASPYALGESIAFDCRTLANSTTALVYDWLQEVAFKEVLKSAGR